MFARGLPRLDAVLSSSVSISGRRSRDRLQHAEVAAASGAGGGQTQPYAAPGLRRHRRGQCQATGPGAPR